MSKNLLWTLVVIGTAAVVIFTVLVVSGPPGAPTSQSARSGAVPEELLVRPDSHRLSTAPRSEVTLVEFLDFECGSCGAAYPAVEQLRRDYAGRLDYVVRYFPVPSHRNADLAAQAAEAAATQGEFEAMYRMLFENQDAWAGAQESQEATFVGYAERIGLDTARFRTDLHSPATAERVQRDRDDGLAAGVTGTPTFFLNGEQLRPESYGDLVAAVEDALRR
ncbi:DsbA family protein [Saccharopolyspora sp. CA-218241]|uniref:DsbA family protein n=1 Tax=Saccharopolyspora sp. CA-218241 TaxID=3240027 RepID=UPI003D98BEB8